MNLIRRLTFWDVGLNDLFIPEKKEISYSVLSDTHTFMKFQVVNTQKDIDE